MSVSPYGSGRRADRDSPAEVVAGFLAATAIFTALIGVAYRPVRIIPFAVGLALLATAIGGRHRGLATLAVVASAVCFIAGMTVAVVTENPLY